jgi:SAM-dependent methyltransferase
MMRPITTIRTIGVGPAVLGSVLHSNATAPPTGLNRLLVGTNQRAFERGWSPPWIWSDRRCRNYWSTRTSTSDGNSPAEIASKSTVIVDAMVAFWGPEISSSASILEVGSNAGPNLERLRQLGYTRLSGVEINDAAIEEMHARFPALAREADIHRGSLEEVLPRRATSSVDVVFSMAVLHHIHPASNSIFAEMVRVARDYVCVIEPETITVPYIFARNYGRVFERLGCTEVRKLEFGPAMLSAATQVYEGYVARLFRVPSS